MAAYKDATNYCHVNHEAIAHFDFAKGHTKQEMMEMLEIAVQRDKRLKDEIEKLGNATFDPTEFKALHELFCFIIQTILGEETFSKYMTATNDALAYLRQYQVQINMVEPGSQKLF